MSEQLRSHLLVRAIIVAAGTLFASVSTSGGGVIPSFTGLGFLTGGGHQSVATAISSDGRVVVGASDSTGSNPYGEQAFAWTAEYGMTGLGFLSSTSASSGALNISGDGQVIVGRSSSATNCTEAFRWSQDGGLLGLGQLPGGICYSDALGASGDGSVIVGYGSDANGAKAFRWTASQGMESLGALPGGLASTATAISPDGSFIVGYSESAMYPNGEPYVWQATKGMVGLGSLEGCSRAGAAFDVSDGGKVIVGSLGCSKGDIPFRWTMSQGLVPLGGINGWARAVSEDGSVIVGHTLGDDETAFVWDQVHGTRVLADVLTGVYGLDLAGWRLLEARDVSADGTSIVGMGVDPTGQIEAWRASIPEPMSLPLVAIACLVFGRLRVRPA